MEKFIIYEKLSKKKQKEINNKKRGFWGNVKPITKIKPSGKLYNRKKKQDMRSVFASTNPVFLCFQNM